MRRLNVEDFGEVEEKKKGTPGQPRKWHDIPLLINGANDYFQYIEDNPLYAFKNMSTRQGVVLTKEPRQRMATIRGYCNHIGIPLGRYYDIRKKPVLQEACEAIESIIKEHQLECGAADLLNSNIVTRVLGLAEKQESKVTSSTKLIINKTYKSDD